MTRTRIAPSPTGEDLHIGNLYTALINFTYAKKYRGDFIIRIEDTDRTRLVEGSEDRILDTLKKFGIIASEGPQIGGDFGPYRQSERKDLYIKYAEELVRMGKAYYSFCSKEQLDSWRKENLQGENLRKKIRDEKITCFSIEEAKNRIKDCPEYTIRLLVPLNEDVKFIDAIRGEISINTEQVDDQVLLKSDGFPTYHLAVVVDDYLMKISHIIRAEEWISSTPKHVLLYRAFGWKEPVFAHVPILRNPDKSKLSKRKNPVWASWYLQNGYLPEAVLNYLCLMGWSHPEQKEIFSNEEFTEVFDIKDLSTVGPAFDQVKLLWMNGMYIRQLNDLDLAYKIISFYKEKNIQLSDEFVQKTIPLVKERIKTLQDYLPMCEFLLNKPISYEVDLSNDKEILTAIAKKLEICDWNIESIGSSMMELAKELNIKNSNFFMILRIAISGKKITPPLNECMEILGKKECIDRIKACL